MDLQERLSALRKRHRELDIEIEEQCRRPRPDADLVRCCKRQKLRIKDKIAALSHEAGNVPRQRRVSIQWGLRCRE